MRYLALNESYEKRYVDTVELTVAIDIAGGIKWIGYVGTKWIAIHWWYRPAALEIIDSINNVDAID